MIRMGLARGTVKIRPYNKKWRGIFIVERRHLNKIFGYSAMGIEHVGSTAIPGLPAKPIIDIVIGVKDLRNVKNINARLTRAGYHLQPKAGVPNKRIFYAKGPASRRTHYLHIVKHGGLEWRKLILFRDYLRRHRTAARQYGELKNKLAAAYPNKRHIYTARKNQFIHRIVRDANKK